MTVDVRTPVFEGPFDLLLHLILREQVDLYEVSLRTIVDAYLAELDRMEHLDLELATEFLLIAATLVELKTRRLLPDHDGIDLDDELALWEERDLLLARLLECKTFKDAAGALRALSERAELVHPRRAGPEDCFSHLAPDVLEGVSPLDLRSAFLRATAPRPQPKVSLAHMTMIRASVTDAMSELITELGEVGRITFRRLTSQLADRIEIVVRFLAVLELFKQGLVDLDQPTTFGELEIVWTGGDLRALELAGVDSYDG